MPPWLIDMVTARQSTRKTLGIISSLIVAMSTIAAIPVSSASLTQSDDPYGFPVRSLTDEQLAAAVNGSEQGSATFDNASYGVDPVVTGPISAKFKRQRAMAKCDETQWPNVPKVCYPD